ncbi:MAG: glycosyltransferase family 2 protein [Bacteroidales bacterium]|nr:glycosyltransferase family 2 protein [Bacteroidales bacterium]
MLITVFTPTFNRAYRLDALYKSLLNQTNNDFEWLIVDDGSTDNTGDLINSWVEENKVNIRYFRQTNGGKHRAINYGVKEAHGTLFFIVDSDDILPLNSIELIAQHYQLIKNRPEFGGLCGLKAYYDGTCVGNSEAFGVYECSNYDIRYKYGLKGDLAEVFLTNTLKEFPFPEIEGERFCPEALVWNRIANKYITHYFSDIIYNCEYLDDGLTKKITQLRQMNPIAASMTYAEMLTAPIPFIWKLRAALNYWRFSKYAIKEKRPKVSNKWRVLKPLASLIF